jgi:hypothetical protein
MSNLIESIKQLRKTDSRFKKIDLRKKRDVIQSMYDEIIATPVVQRVVYEPKSVVDKSQPDEDIVDNR